MSRNSVTTVDIEAPPAQVFAVLCDVERWPEWTPTMTRVRRREAGPLTVGSTADVQQPKLRAARWQVTQVAESRNFTWTSRSPGLRMVAGHRIEPFGGGSRVTLSFELSGLLAPLVSRLYGNLIDGYVVTESQSLKRRCESGSSAAYPGNR